MISEALVRFVGVMVVLTVLAALGSVAVAGASSKLSELQLSGDPQWVQMFVQGKPAAVARMKRQLRADYGFIVCYWLAFVALAILLARRGGAGYRIAGFAALLAASTTALLDLLENLRTSGVLALSRPGDQVRLQPVVHLRRTSLLKWGASASTLALLSIAFIPGRSWLLALGITTLVVAAVGFLAQWQNRLITQWQNRLIKVYMGLFLLLAAVIAVWFTGWPGDVVGQL